jgi:hypothetical protein
MGAAFGVSSVSYGLTASSGSRTRRLQAQPLFPGRGFRRAVHKPLRAYLRRIINLGQNKVNSIGEQKS